jgi:ubiquinone biosynthesis protein COQ9
MHMMSVPERSAERDAAIDALLPHVPSRAWTRAGLVAALREQGRPPEDARLLFPGGTSDLIETFLDLADRRMEAAAAERNIGALRVPERVRTVIALRLEQQRPHWEAVRRAVAWLMIPGNAALAWRCTARTVDAIWYAAQDRSADFSWYTKRATLTPIYVATLLYWLRDGSGDDAGTLAFLDRRLAGVARIGRLRRRTESVLSRCARRAA